MHVMAVWPEITEAEVGAMLDNIDLDFDQSYTLRCSHSDTEHSAEQTTSTKEKYMNCTNDIKSVNVAASAKTIDHDNRLSSP